MEDIFETLKDILKHIHDLMKNIKINPNIEIEIFYGIFVLIVE